MTLFDPPVNPPSRLSVSAMRQFNECSWKYKLSRVDKVPEEGQTHHMWAGSVLHACFMLAYGKPLPGTGRTEWEVDNAGEIQDCVDLFEMLWDGEEYATGMEDDLGLSRAQKAYRALKTDPQLAPIPARQFGYGQLKALKEKNHEERKANYKKYFLEMLTESLQMGLAYPVVGLEKEVRYNLGGVPMLGYIDIVMRNDQGELVYLDLKTGASKPSEKALMFDDQMAAYYTCELDGELPAEIWYHAMKHQEIMHVPKNLPLIEALNHSAPRIMQEIQEGRFVKNVSQDCASCKLRHACMGL